MNYNDIVYIITGFSMFFGTIFFLRLLMKWSKR